MSNSAQPTRADDLSALAWVNDELRRSLEAAHKALRRYLREAETATGSDVDEVDPAVLRTARVNLHQGAGALELVGLPLPAQVLRAGEAVVQRFIAKPKLADAAGVEVVERASFAVLDYLARMLAGKPVAALELFPQFEAAQLLAGAQRAHPADLWPHDAEWRELPDDATAVEIVADDEARERMEALVLLLMRGTEPAAAKAMSDLCAGLGATAGGDLRALWKLAAAVFEAQFVGLLDADVHTKRMASRLLAQLRQSVRGETTVSDRLAQDLQFFCSRAQDCHDATLAPRLSAVQTVWPRDEQASADYVSSRLGRHDPAVIVQARRRVGAAKDLWSALAGGEMHRMSALPETVSLLSESIAGLFPGGERLVQALKTSTARVFNSGAAPAPALAMEVATGLLYLEAALEEGDLDNAELPTRMGRLAERMERVASGADAEPLEAWMEELYRRVSDRQTMGSVVQELRASLSEIEKQIDQYFRDPAKRELLIPVPNQLSAMRGVLSVLGLGQASQAVLHMRQAVDELAQTEVDPHLAIQTGTFERLADNLGALSFLIDMISVQPQLAKTLFRFDPESGSLSAVMGQSERASAFAELDIALPVPAATPAAAPAPAPAPELVSGLEDDQEMRDIFLEEAREVVADALGCIARLTDLPNDVNEMTALRRAFHTLKGSSRMVGLTAFGDAAWSCEQLYNAHLAQPGGMDADLLGFTGEALDYLSAWVDQIAEGTDHDRRSLELSSAADALRLDGKRQPIGGSAQDAAIDAPATLQALVPDLPSADDLDLGLPVLDDEPTIVLEHAQPAAEPEPQIDETASFDLDLDLMEAAAPESATDTFEPILELEPTAAEAPAEPDVTELSLDDLEALLPVPDVVPESTAAVEVEDLTQDTLTDFAATTDGLPRDLVESASAPLVDVGDMLSLDIADESETPADEVDLPIDTAPAPLPETTDEPMAESPAEDEFKVVGSLRIAIPLFNIFLNEADEQSRRLVVELAEWSLEQDQPMAESTIALAHSLAGNSGTVGFVDLSILARALEHALMRSRNAGRGSPGEAELFVDAGEEIRRLLHQFAAGFLNTVRPDLMPRLAEHERLQVPQEEPVLPVDDEPPPHSRFAALEPAAQRPEDADFDQDLDATDAIDADLFPIFEEEADELLPQLRARLTEWSRHPSNTGAPTACLRTLHTFKGGARLAGAMRVGEMAHRLESAIEQLCSRGDVSATDVEHLLARADTMAFALEQVRQRGVPGLAVLEAPLAPSEIPTPTPGETVLEEAQPLPLPQAVTPEAGVEPEAETAPPAPPEVSIDWSRFTAQAAAAEVDASSADAAPGTQSIPTVRVRATLLDRLVNEAGEVSITRARIEGDMRAMQGSLNDLTDNLERLRRQLRDLELQAETQITSRIEAAKAAAQTFDPLEMDRFTRFQELTRMMAESVNDVATVQRGLQRTLQSTEDELAAQARLTRDLQDDLLRTRMVEFESLADRLYRVVRQAAKDTGKSVRLDIVGGSIEVDRGVLERMVGPFEHLLRNSVAHGIEAPARRKSAAKDDAGTILVTVTHERNDVSVEFADDGAGIDLDRVRKQAIARGLLSAKDRPSNEELLQLIYQPGFSTAEGVSELAGRGIGMDVVRSEVVAMGGRIETHSEPGRGTRIRLVLPLTTAVTQVVLVRFGAQRVAVPSTLVEIVLRMRADDLRKAYASGTLQHADESVPLYWLGALLQQSSPGQVEDRAQAVIVVRSASQRVALHIDEVIGSQEVVVKQLGPQMSRLPGIAGITLLPSGAAALIYNPVALAAVYGAEARKAQLAPPASDGLAQPTAQAETTLAPLIMVVDDSLTVRRVTQRLLVREGYRVTLAKDGLEAIERLAVERPAVLLSDIEMPRMDGFDLVRNVRADARLAGLPVIMITSRIAQKHRDHAAELGVDHYLGKPYSEEELLAIVNGFVNAAALH